MRADVRNQGMLRPDLLQAIAGPQAALPPLARRVLCLRLQVEGRHRPPSVRESTTPTCSGADTPTTTASVPKST